ncbi:hypothetical protein [Comamonas thiooxydans]|uniref:hypothetical protein n=1 Tax=Comamonas thiooxydans TaxID=363952 RepID=UPI000B40F3EC|nr:hypothetical protein [Comamonas thiooxydans]
MGHNKLNEAHFHRYASELSQGEQLYLHCTIVESLREGRRVIWEGRFWTNEEARGLKAVLERLINKRLTQSASR